jgi:hypothetical protein
MKDRLDFPAPAWLSTISFECMIAANITAVEITKKK